MAYRRKAHLLLAHKPDIVVISECESPDKLVFGDGVEKPTSIVWYGDNQHKGLAVIAFNNYKLQLLSNHKPRYKTVLPIAVTGGGVDFTLFAVWANNPQDKQNQYVGQVWKAIRHYKDLLLNTPIMLAGDFNSNTIWDKPRRKGNHSAVVEYLEKRAIHSTYHQHFKLVQGKEEHATFYLYRHEDKPYHLDYCFASKHFMDRLRSVEVGTHAEWKLHSDHPPLIVTFGE